LAGIVEFLFINHPGNGSTLLKNRTQQKLTENRITGIFRLLAKYRNKEITMGLSEIFNALSDPTRRDILTLLGKGDLTAGEIAEHFSLAKSTMSGHFNVLHAAGLVVKERLGTRIVYSLNTSVCEEALGATFSLFNVGGNIEPPDTKHDDDQEGNS
jgi:ArsR family transcriptional regulator